jgi:hypothetical protein
MGAGRTNPYFKHVKNADTFHSQTLAGKGNNPFRKYRINLIDKKGREIHCSGVKNDILSYNFRWHND